jgi:hypothetical protein
MTARNDPLARVQAMVDAWGSAETFDTFDTGTSDVSPPNRLENCGFRHSRHFRHRQSEHLARSGQSVGLYPPESLEREDGSRISYSDGVESVESVENSEKRGQDNGLAFDTSSLHVSKSAEDVSKAGPPTASVGVRAAGVPVQWTSGVARLANIAPPRTYPAHVWQQLVGDAERFIEEWAPQAAALGWPAWELFGCHRRASWARIDGMGLVLLLHGDPLAALTATEAVIRRASGARQTWRRKQRDPLTEAERCLVWELADAC